MFPSTISSSLKRTNEVIEKSKINFEEERLKQLDKIRKEYENKLKATDEEKINILKSIQSRNKKRKIEIEEDKYKVHLSNIKNNIRKLNEEINLLLIHIPKNETISEFSEEIDKISSQITELKIDIALYTNFN